MNWQAIACVHHIGSKYCVRLLLVMDNPSENAVDGSGPVFAASPVKQFSLVLDKYSCSNKRRGRCIIINNHHFNKQLTRQSDRDGTEVDAAAVQKVFKSLGFDVTRYDDLTVTDMSINLREASREDHSDADCFACVILSHGDEGVVFGTNGTIGLASLFAVFKGDQCPTLAGKPKLFFIQACRGHKFDRGVDSVDEPDSLGSDEVDSASIRRIPVEADVLVAYSVVPGYFSWRNNVDGSWFIQALIRVLNQYGPVMEMLQILTLVNKVVAYDFESCTDQEFTSGMKQVPCIVSTLTKQLYFEPKPSSC